MVDLHHLTQAQLLALRFCDLELGLEGALVAQRASRVFDELSARRILAPPVIWLAEEWYNPDGVVGFAIPFYLAHPRLIRLERKMMLEAEGAAERECIRILRHETGHAIDEAFQLHRTPEYRLVFGSAGKPYPTSYAVTPDSRAHVYNLNAWYAQAHPVEDFAETFAVWLASHDWRRRYQGWPALAKLEAVDRWMRQRAGSPPLLRPDANAAPVRELQSNRRTLAAHYAEKRAFYRIEEGTRLDRPLKQIFGQRRQATGTRSAIAAIRESRSALRKEISRPLGVPAYAVDQVIRHLIQRAKSLQLAQTRSNEETFAMLEKLVRRTTLAILNQGQRLPL